MNSRAQVLMMGAPGNVTKEQLRDDHIKWENMCVQYKNTHVFCC